MKTDKNKSGDFCPLIKSICIERDCKFWIKLKGKDPQSLNEVDHWDCAISWMPILLIEGTQANSFTTASIDKLVNEVKTSKYNIIKMPSNNMKRL